mmetsp:Transcript_90869/g.257403  ORF Transcript_90869/g.257403 Transcript_90869/m.257403 type:complete len:169 (+) Transcript_90869:20-526(+)
METTGRGRGRGGRGRRGRAGPAESDGAGVPHAPQGEQPAPAEAQTPDATQPHMLSSNIQAMRFMQSAREEEKRKKQKQDQLRHLEDMQWVLPGFEDEVQEIESCQEKRAPEGDVAPVLLHRRSYKGFNPVVELWMQDQLKKHAEARSAAEELEQAATLRKMKQRRVRS